MSSSSFLITGGLGGLGGSLVSHILQNTTGNVAILDNLSSPSYGLFSCDRVRFYRGDTCNEELIGYILKENKVDTVIDCSTRKTPKNALEAANLLKNITHLLDSLRTHPDLKHFVLASRPQRPQESQPLCPSDFGLASLMSAEAMLHSYVISYRLPLVIARVSLIAEHLQEYKNLEGFVNIISANDAAKGVLAAIGGKPAGVYNICGKGDFDSFALRKGEFPAPKDSIFSIKKASEELGFTVSDDVTKIVPRDSSVNGLNKVLLFGQGAVADHLENVFKKDNILFRRAITLPGVNDDKTVAEELTKEAPSHVISVCNEEVDEGDGTPCEKLKISTYSLLFPPWQLASMCEKRGIHFTFIGSPDIFTAEQLKEKPLTEEVDGKNQETNNGAVRAFTERLIRHFPSALQIRFDVSGSDLIEKLEKLILQRQSGVWNVAGPSSSLDCSKLLKHFQ